MKFRFQLWLFRRWLKFVVRQGHDYRLIAVNREIWKAAKRTYTEDNEITLLGYLIQKLVEATNDKPQQHQRISLIAQITQEALRADRQGLRARVIEWRELSDSALRLRCGEMTAQEIRTVRAVLNALL